MYFCFAFYSYNNDSSVSYRMIMAVLENGWATSFVILTIVAQRARVTWTGCRLGGSHPDSVPLTRGAAQAMLRPNAPKTSRTQDKASNVWGWCVRCLEVKGSVQTPCLPEVDFRGSVDASVT